MMFLERLIQTGMQDNPYWYSLDYNWFAKNDLWLPNCTCFSCGRSSEAAGRNVKLQIPRGNAQTWYDASNWIGSRTPKVGAIAVWGGGKYGHVGVVERINSDGSVLISQSNYTRASKEAMIANYFVIGTYKPEVGKVTKHIGWTFLGYLINPYIDDKRVSRNPNRRQVEIHEERVRARKSPNGEIYKGLFIPMGTYNILDQDGDWVKVDDAVWFSLGSWSKVYEPDNELYRELQDLIAKRDELNRQIEELKKKLEA
ncbi:MAG: CHAP domain-containing protein [Lachnospiraceae bacterium]|nr:CHAP domain-containing protein [Lachnospiraceae bacterium]